MFDFIYLLCTSGFWGSVCAGIVATLIIVGIGIVRNVIRKKFIIYSKCLNNYKERLKERYKEIFLFHNSKTYLLPTMTYNITEGKSIDNIVEFLGKNANQSIILGKAGSGKTAFSRYLRLCCINHKYFLIIS